ncbi:MAG TPA: HAD family hydrolase, partial [Sphingomonas sp.]|nr:HAD family hydrolase [Sphingomonas sp.]
PGRIQAVFFDIDGTLVDSNEHHVTAWDVAFRDAGHAVDPAAIRGQIGKGGDLLVPTLLPEVAKSEIDALSDAHGKAFKRRHLGRITPFAEASALLRHTHRRGQRVVLASSADGKEVAHYIKLLKVRDIVDATTSIDDVETSKPAGDIFAAALKKVRLAPDEVIVVGDTPYDVEAAMKCGIDAIGVLSGGFDEAVLRGAGAVAVYDDVAALLADYARSPLAG